MKLSSWNGKYVWSLIFKCTPLSLGFALIYRPRKDRHLLVSANCMLQKEHYHEISESFTRSCIFEPTSQLIKFINLVPVVQRVVNAIRRNFFFFIMVDKF